jgi:hypothetical protein
MVSNFTIGYMPKIIEGRSSTRYLHTQYVVELFIIAKKMDEWKTKMWHIFRL